MTDAERIAGYLNRYSIAGYTPQDIEQEARFRPHEKGALLMAMLSDVRREEREACEQEIQGELAEAERQGERMAVKFLGWALKHIKARGTK